MTKPKNRGPTVPDQPGVGSLHELVQTSVAARGSSLKLTAEGLTQRVYIHLYPPAHRHRTLVERRTEVGGLKRGLPEEIS